MTSVPHAHHVRGQSRRGERADELRHRDEHLAAEVAALLLRRELILEVDRGRAGLDHHLHQLERVQRAAEARFRVGDDRREPVRAAAPFDVVDLIGALQGLIDPLHDLRDGVRRIETLVGIHVAGEVRVRRDLPAGEVDRLETGAHLLDGLIAGERAEGVHVRLGVEQVPQPLGAHLGERVLDVDRAAQTQNVLRACTRA